MRRLIGLVGAVGGIAILQVLHLLHSTRVAEIPYDLYGSGRWFWSFILGVAAMTGGYVIGLPGAARDRSSVLTMAAASYAVGVGSVSIIQLALGQALLPRFVAGVGGLVYLPFTLLTWHLARDESGMKSRNTRVLAICRGEVLAELEQDLSGEERVILAGTMSIDAAGNGGVLRSATENRASIVVLDTAAQNDVGIVEQAATLHEAGVRVRTLSLFYEDFLAKLPLADLERVSLMFDIGEVHRMRYGRMKRVLDLLVAVLALPLVGAIALLLVLLNPLLNPGPLFYRQDRQGRGGQSFQILKFRSMVQGNGPAVWTRESDDRITRLGGILRRSHMDETPQMINVALGHLSLVGPRPEQVAYVAELTEKLPFYEMRHLVRPGITGWAQVNYGYGASESDALQKLQYDFYYLRRQNLVLDLRILLKTVRLGVILGGR